MNTIHPTIMKTQLQLSNLLGIESRDELNHNLFDYTMSQWP